MASAFDDLIPGAATRGADPFADLVPVGARPDFSNVVGGADTLSAALAGALPDALPEYASVVDRDPRVFGPGMPLRADPLAPLGSVPPPAATTNPLEGARARIYDLAGSGIRGIANIAERLGDKLETAIPLTDLTPEQIANEQQLAPLFRLSDYLREQADAVGYTPAVDLPEVKQALYQPVTGLGDFAGNLGTVGRFAVDQALTSTPDMAAAITMLPAYVLGRTQEIGERRVANDAREGDPTLGDLAAAAPAAVIESTLERFATRGLGQSVAPTVAGRVLRELGLQTGTETVEEAIANLGESLGTERGVSAQELGDAALGGALGGVTVGGAGALGGEAVRAVRSRAEALQAAKADFDAAARANPEAWEQAAAAAAERHGVTPAEILSTPDVAVPPEPTADLDAQLAELLLRNQLGAEAPQADAPTSSAIDPAILAAGNAALAASPEPLGGQAPQPEADARWRRPAQAQHDADFIQRAAATMRQQATERAAQTQADRPRGDTVTPAPMPADATAAPPARAPALPASSPVTAEVPQPSPATADELPRGTTTGSAAEIVALAEEAARSAPREKRAVSYAEVTPEQAERLRAETGLDLTGYRHTVDNYGVRHAIKGHGVPEEAKRGQLPLEPSDFERIPDIVENYDSAELVGKDGTGNNDLIRYTKRYNGTVYYVEEVRNKRRELTAKTLWKTRTTMAGAAPQAALPSLTSETLGRSLPEGEQMGGAVGGLPQADTTTATPQGDDTPDAPTPILYGRRRGNQAETGQPSERARARVDRMFAERDGAAAEQPEPPETTPEHQHRGWATRNANLGERYAEARRALLEAEAPLRTAREEAETKLPPGYKTIPHATRSMPDGVALIHVDEDGFERDVAYPLTPSEAADRAWQDSGRDDRFAGIEAMERRMEPELSALRDDVAQAQAAWDANGRSPMEPIWEQERRETEESERRKREAAAKAARTRAAKKKGKRAEEPDALESTERASAFESLQRGEEDAELLGLRQAVNTALGETGERVIYLRGIDGLPERLQRGVRRRLEQRAGRGRAAAIYDPAERQVYLFTDVVQDPKAAVFNAAHEIAGHQGLRELLGDQLNGALEIALQNQTVQAVADAVAKQRNLRPTQRLLAAEEALAELAAAVRTGDYDAIEQRYKVTVPEGIRASVARAVENFLRRLKALIDRAFGQTFTDEDVRSLLEAAWQAAQGEPSVSVQMPDGSAVLEQAAFHGTPHTVDRFRMDKIGTGEGNQVYGWGAYFASKREVAEAYRENVKDMGAVQRINARLRDLANIMAADQVPGSYRKYRTDAGREASEEYDQLLSERSGVSNAPGKLYRVEIPEDGDLLDWDKPITEQPTQVREAMERMLSDGTFDPDALGEWNAAKPHAQTGQRFYRLLVGSNTAPVRVRDPQENASLLLNEAGIPGLRYLDGNSRGSGDGSHNYVIWDEAAIGEPEALESVEYTPEQAAALEKAGLRVDRRTRIDRVRDRLREEWSKVREAARDRDALKQAMFDRFHGLRAAEAQVGLSDPEQSPYIAARMSAGSASQMEGLMLYGAPKWDGGVLGIDSNTVGLLDALKPVRDHLDEWLGWMVGRRAQLLKQQGRENNLTDADIKALLSLADGREAEFKKAAADYLKIKNAVLDVAEQAGLIDPVARAAWDHAEYIPFYRQEGDRAIGPGTRRGLEGQSSGIRTLKGGEAALHDPLANIVRNFSKLLDAANKNRAVLLAVDGLGAKFFQPAPRQMQPATIPLDQVKKHLRDQGVDEATIAGMPPTALNGVQRMLSIVPPSGEDVVRVMREGKPEYYKVLDPLVLRALTAFKEPVKGVAIKPFIWFKRLLTTGVTTTAEFVGANFLRDSGSAWVISDDRFRPGWDSLAGVARTLANDAGTREMTMAGATFMGGNFYDGNADAAAAALRRALRKKGIRDRDLEGFMGTVARSPLHLWDAWMRLSGAVENANRRAVYDAALRSGRSKTEAAYMARDLMDFSMQGDAAWVQFFSDVLPFFNARLQGMYKLGRRAGTKEGRRAIILRGGVLALASAALYAWNMAMYGDAYDDLEEWDKDAYWHIAPGTEHHVRIPKPFELGLIFGTAPERAMQAIRNATTGEGDKPSATWDALVRALTGTLAMNPIPQAALPVVEQWANKRFFTDRAIENMGDEKLLPEARAEWYTSDTAKAISSVVGNETGLSPKRIEHLWNGYTAGLGGYVLDASDAVVRMVEDSPERPEMAKKDWPILGRFLRGGSPGSTKYTEQFYTKLRRAEQIEQTIKEYTIAGRAADARDLERENADLLGERIESKRAKGGFLYAKPKALRKVRGQLSGLREEMEDVALSRQLSDHEKRVKLDELTAQRNKLVKDAVLDR